MQAVGGRSDTLKLLKMCVGSAF